MKTFLIIILVFLLASVGLNVWQWKSAHEQEENMLANNEKLQTQITHHKAARDTALSREKRSEVLRISEREKNSIEITRLKTRNKGTSEKIVILRVPVQSLIDSVEALGTFVAAQDSSILEKDNIIAKTEEAWYNDVKRYSEQNLQLHVAVLQSDSVSNNFKQVAENATNLYEKQKRKKFSIGVSGGYSVVSTGGEVRTGPAIQIGIVYNLFKF